MKSAGEAGERTGLVGRVAGLVLCLSLLLGAAFLFWNAARPPQSDRAFRQLVAALDGSRVGEGRFASLRYGPVGSPIRSGEAVDLSPDVKIAVAQLQQAVA